MNGEDDNDNDSCSSAVATAVTTDCTSSIVSDEISSHVSEFCGDDEEDDSEHNDIGDEEEDERLDEFSPHRSVASHQRMGSTGKIGPRGTNFVALGLAPLAALLAGSWYASSVGTSDASGLSAIAMGASTVTIRMYRWYMRVLEEWPALTKSLTTAIIQFLGDGVAQWYEQQQEQQQQRQQEQEQTPFRTEVPAEHGPQTTNNQGKNDRAYDLRRGLSLFFDGLVLSGPLLHYCYEYMEKIWPTSSDEGGFLERPLATLCHVFVNDYFIDTFYIAISFVFTGLAEGYNRTEITEIFRKDFWATARASWLVSLGLFPVEIFCFGYLSLSLRVLAMNFVDLLWGSIVSFYSHRSRREEPSRLSRGEEPWAPKVVEGCLPEQ